MDIRTQLAAHLTEPSIRYAANLQLLDRDPQSPEMVALQQEIPASARVQTLLSEMESGQIFQRHPYSKFDGAHWIISHLADLYLPPGDQDLVPLREHVYTFFFRPDPPGWKHVRRIFLIQGRTRACASIESNALFALLRLGLADSRCEQLAELLLGWQWPDGGWNCDRIPNASHSSFHESLIPIRALSLYGRLSGDPRCTGAVERAVEVFLKRGLFRRQRDGQVIHPQFILLHFPRYWHYDILGGLLAMKEAGVIGDPRCAEALDLLESKRLPDGGFPLENKYDRVAGPGASGRSMVNWGGTGRRKMNPWVTLEALTVLRAAGR